MKRIVADSSLKREEKKVRPALSLSPKRPTSWNEFGALYLQDHFLSPPLRFIIVIIVLFFFRYRSNQSSQTRPAVAVTELAGSGIIDRWVRMRLNKTHTATSLDVHH